jgi:P27 family predicted phage terminase small subunit
LPTSIKLLRGNPGKRPLNGAEPKPRAKIPPCPAHLDDEAKREWRRTSRELANAGLITVVDRGALAAYCQSWSRWVEAETNLRKAGMVVKTKNGHPMLNPFLTIANEAMRQMKAFLVEFGMTPSSRSRVHAEDQGATDPMEDLLFGRRSG